LKAWKNISGISVLLNTSFNKKGMPMVEKPEDAISFFMESDLDVLVIGNFICTKK
jgi:carbamoyltransferase